jgi:DNA-binding transcriptional LysR family regulator
VTEFTLRQVEYFCAVARAGTLAGAADGLLVSRSALTAGLDELERALGVTLLRRRRASGVELTPEGAHFLDGALSLLLAADDLSGRVSQRTLVGELHVGCFGSLAPTVLPAPIAAFARDYPAVDVIIQATSQDLLIHSLASGDLELAVLYRTEPFPQLESALLYRTRMHVVLHEAHPLAQEDVVPAAGLGGDPFVLLETPPSADQAMGYLNSLGITPRIAQRTSSFELARSLVGRGLGYALFVQQSPTELTFEGRRVVARELDPAPHDVEVGIFWPRGRTLSARARRFIDFAQANGGDAGV